MDTEGHLWAWDRALMVGAVNAWGRPLIVALLADFGAVAMSQLNPRERHLLRKGLYWALITHRPDCLPKWRT